MVSGGTTDRCSAPRAPHPAPRAADRVDFYCYRHWKFEDKTNVTSKLNIMLRNISVWFEPVSYNNWYKLFITFYLRSFTCINNSSDNTVTF